jgi:hypothetical protein
MASGAPVTVATAQILINVTGNAGPMLAEIGTLGPKVLVATQTSADQLTASMNALAAATELAATNNLFMSTGTQATSEALTRASGSASELGANELGLAVSSEKATVAMEEQSAAAELFNKKLGKLLDGTTVLTKFFKTFASFLVATLIYGALTKLIEGFQSLTGASKAAAKAAEDYQGAIDSVREAQLRLSHGVFETTKLMRLPDGTLESVKSYGTEIDALQKKITSTEQALQAARDSGGGPWGKLFGGDADGFAAEMSTLVDALTAEERNAAFAATDDDETVIDAHIRLMQERLGMLKYLDGAYDRAIAAQQAVDKAQGGAMQSGAQLLVQEKESIKVAMQASAEQETYALKLKATNLAIQMGVDQTSQKLIIDKILAQHQQLISANVNEELNQRERLIGLRQDEIEQLQLYDQLHGAIYKDSDPQAAAEIAAQEARLRAIQDRERMAQLTQGISAAFAQVPEDIAFGAGLKKTVRDAFISAGRQGFADLITRPLTDMIDNFLRGSVTELPAIAAQTHLATSLDVAVPAMTALAIALEMNNALTPAKAAGTIGVLAAAANGAVWPGGFQAFAGGGVVNQPTVGLVGEGQYTEAVIPMPDGRSVPVTLSGGGGDYHVHVHMNVQAIDSRDFKAHLSENADHVGNVIIDQLRGRNRQLVDRVRSASRGRS